MADLSAITVKNANPNVGEEETFVVFYASEIRRRASLIATILWKFWNHYNLRIFEGVAATNTGSATPTPTPRTTTATLKGNRQRAVENKKLQTEKGKKIGGHSGARHQGDGGGGGCVEEYGGGAEEASI
ncbi:hypothetical protein PIB30_023699 [Stylosanthes scabra]|uniref:Uncharacterized protein n=1 Tax=Stylosanthes scabra TaxID=79078 RepID=A0ABU6U8F1_9FABA|nr:hypothetical protein [Stylosanthes scabra]